MEPGLSPLTFPGRYFSPAKTGSKTTRGFGLLLFFFFFSFLPASKLIACAFQSVGCPRKHKREEEENQRPSSCRVPRQIRLSRRRGEVPGAPQLLGVRWPRRRPCWPPFWLAGLLAGRGKARVCAPSCLLGSGRRGVR